MNLRNALRVIAVLSLLFGIGFALAPGLVFAPYGVHLDAAGTFVGRIFGAANVGFAIALWSGAGLGPAMQRSLGWGVIGYSAIEAIATGAAVLGGVANSLAWAFVVLDVLFIAACLVLMRSGAAEPMPATASSGV